MRICLIPLFLFIATTTTTPSPTLLIGDNFDTIETRTGQCQRPNPGCTDDGDIYKSVDCDGDGILDHACHNTINNNRWLVLSSESCPNSWGSPSRPGSKCPEAFGDQCWRPLPGCTDDGDIYKSVDCDGDGILDHACHNTVNNNRWLVLSSESCPNSWGVWDQPVSKCPQAFGEITTATPPPTPPPTTCEDIKSTKFCEKAKKKGKCSKASIWKKCQSTCEKCDVEEPCEDQKSSKFCKKALAKGKCGKSSILKKCKKTCDKC